MTASVKTAGRNIPDMAIPPASITGKMFTTVDQGRLHIAIENRYIGSIDSYNNWLTQSVASLFG